MTKTLIHGGAVHLGGSKPSRPADVLISDGSIVDILAPGRSDAIDALRIDASGALVTPGFIDVHTHSDVSLLLDGRGESKIHQGVTTEVTGNCGFSAAPIVPEHRDEHLDLLAGIGDDPIDVSWTDMAGYAREVEGRGVSLNVVPLVGHGQLRIAASATAQTLERDSIAKMKWLLAEQLEQGAFGMSTGLTYVPSCFADTAELTALCETLASYNAIYATHARSQEDDPIAEAVELGTTGVRVQYSHVAINDPQRWGQADQLIAEFDEARATGIDIAYDLYPYAASASALTQYLPAWVQVGGARAMAERLGNAATFRLAAEEFGRGWSGTGGKPWLWDRLLLSRTDGLCGVRDGQTVEEAAAEQGVAAADLVLSLCQAGGNRIQVVLFYRCEDDVRTFLRQPYALIGSDGSAIPFEQHGRRPHPRAFGAHGRLFGRYVRELGDLEVDDAIHRVTGAASDRFGIRGRGRLAPGAAADLVVMSPDSVMDTATFLEPNRAAVGIDHVLVNGELVIEHGRHTGSRPGRVLRAR